MVAVLHLGEWRSASSDPSEECGGNRYLALLGWGYHLLGNLGFWPPRRHFYTDGYAEGEHAQGTIDVIRQVASKGSQNPETAGRSFARASDRLMRVLGRKLLPHAIAPGEWLVLCELVDAGRMMPSTLAERLNMSRGGVSRLVDRMVERGLIDRTADTNDRRAHWLSVSPKGLDSMPGIEVAVAEGEEQFFGRLSQTERRNLHTILSRLADSDRR